ncbi:ARS binding protein 2 [Colletotrichum graminicola M1.001]|uniref:ARS binding protein 2 n=1 Tax=Colletotrichum graminicola (strain M1.001 / M2 / FGSC 10212) TaxID=645133 RepID=E3QGJ1_COLGM|nr:ARS binding protein 2 [Colletotrichum graminicola M1.001]EFQ29979.1 ARS binding protein 2 [Colletotrichum graminicola M1.001]
MEPHHHHHHHQQQQQRQQQQQQQHKTAAAAAAAVTTSVPSTTSTPANSIGRPALPDRDVTAETIEDAYVNFILHCNPAVPPETDAAALREAFRVPPRSGGKSFSTFTLFQLIRQLETKEIKTWAELALKLGVEPPDQDKGQSSQKIQQYAVRLKRWMHSMHVDAFFEYLMDHPHQYWIGIPNDPNPVCEAGRDGVLAEDDMALRALLPQIRPRRGRKRPDEDESSRSPSQRPRLDSPLVENEYAPNLAETSGPWSAHPDGRASFGKPDSSRLSANSALASAWPPVHDSPLTAFTQGPMSALTPSTRSGGFWGDAEPGSAITPSRPKASTRRHGAKVVSSAWRSSGPGGTGKTRGRPPTNKTNVDGLFVAFSAEKSPLKGPSPETKSDPGPIKFPGSIPNNVSPTIPPDIVHAPPMTRPGKPSISLQVPQRAGGAVRLATPPPPVVVINADPAQHIPNPTVPITRAPSATLKTDSGNAPPGTTPCMNLHEQSVPRMQLIAQDSDGPNSTNDLSAGMFENMEDRTNIDEVVGYLANETLNGDWFDAQDNPIDKCSIAEAYAIVHTMLERMWQTAPNQDVFLLNLSALVGGRTLLPGSRLQCKREEELEDRTTYSCNWQFRLGSIRGNYTMCHTTTYDRWRRPEEMVEKPSVKRTAEAESEWEKKYRDLLVLSEKRGKEIQSLRAGITMQLNKTFDASKDLGI